MGPDLIEQPRVADAPTANHQPPRPGLAQHLGSTHRRPDISIRHHRTLHRRNRLRNPVVPNLRAVHVGHRPAMNCQKIDGMPRKNLQKRLPFLMVRKPQSGLHREPHPGDGVAQRAQQGIDPTRFAEKPTTGTLPVNHRSRAAEVEINGRHRKFLELTGGTHHGHRIVPDELGDRRTPGRILPHRFQDGPFDGTGRMHPGILGPIDVRTAVPCQQAPEGQVRDVLHGRQGQNRRRPGQQGVERRHRPAIGINGKRAHPPMARRSSGSIRANHSASVIFCPSTSVT